MFRRKKKSREYTVRVNYDGNSKYYWSVTYPGRDRPSEWGFDCVSEHQAIESAAKEVRRHMAMTNYKEVVLTFPVHLETT